MAEQVVETIELLVVEILVLDRIGGASDLQPSLTRICTHMCWLERELRNELCTRTRTRTLLTVIVTSERHSIGNSSCDSCAGMAENTRRLPPHS